MSNLTESQEKIVSATVKVVGTLLLMLSVAIISLSLLNSTGGASNAVVDPLTRVSVGVSNSGGSFLLESNSNAGGSFGK